MEEGKTYHCCISVRGLITEKKKILKGFFPTLNHDEAKEFLMDCLSEGKEVLPFGEPCEGFDYKDGCKGHVKQREDT